MRQFRLMTRPRPHVQIIVDVESMMREMVSTSEAQSQAQEPPPKDEELEEQEAPPQYSSCVLEIKDEENSQESNDNNVGNQDPKPENLAVMEQSVRRFV